MQVVEARRSQPRSASAGFDPARMVPFGYDDTDYGTPEREGAAVTLTIDGREVTVPAGTSVRVNSTRVDVPVPGSLPASRAHR